MGRWDRYRNNREEAIDEYIAHFKLMKKVSYLVTLIVKNKILRRFCDNVLIW